MVYRYRIDWGINSYTLFESDYGDLVKYEELKILMEVEKGAFESLRKRYNSLKKSLKEKVNI